MVNMSAKFDKEICNGLDGLVSIVFTRSSHGWTEPHTDGRTEPQQRYYIPTATRCAGIEKNWYDWRVLIIRNVHVKYESSTSNDSKVTVKDNFLVKSVEFHCQGHKVIKLLTIERVSLVQYACQL